MSRCLILTATALVLGACSAERDPPPAANSAPAEMPPPTSAAPASAPVAAPAPTGLAPLTAEGWGPLRIGMTLAEITAALGPDADPQAVGGAEPESCDQFRPQRAPQGMLLMVEAGRLTRISLIPQAKVKTDHGLGLGATAAQVRAAYGGKLEATPHKYVDAPAEYLTVWAKGGVAADGAVPDYSRGIQFVVDATGEVGTIHAGGPSILYVEGCL